MGSNIRLVLRDLENLRPQIQAAIEPALDRAAQILLMAKQREKQATYARPIPLTKSGKPKWKRSGDFARGDVIQRSRGRRSIVMTGNAARYEERLATLPVSRDGVNRRNAAAPNARLKSEKQAIAAFEQIIYNALD